MSMLKLAAQNFKKSVSSYLSLIFSLAFTVMILFNLQSLVYMDTFAVLQEGNQDKVDILVQAFSVVLAFFLFFFIWYATNVFLTRRKKEIGIYVFMGLTNQRIGVLYALETTMMGLAALAVGLGLGVLLSQLFRMILLAFSGISAELSDISVELHLTSVAKPMLVTALIFGAVYLIFVVKGYLNIVRSSVLGMISANRKNEFVWEKTWLLAAKAVLGAAALAAGFYLAVKDGGMEVFNNLLSAVVLVTAGVYLLFGGFLPLLFHGLVKRKEFLYHGGRVLWLNNMVFRMKKNYRTYAITCVLMLCSVTALATSFAMKLRYDVVARFRTVYTYQVLSDRVDVEEELEALIDRDNDVVYHTRADILSLDSPVTADGYNGRIMGVVSYSQVCAMAEAAELQRPVREPGDDEVIRLGHAVLMSFLTDKSIITYEMNGRAFREIEELCVPYFGYLQESVDFLVVNDRIYEELLPLGMVLHSYHFGIADPGNFAASKEELEEFAQAERDQGRYMGCVRNNPVARDILWVKILYSLGIFVFLVFVLAGGSILFMKVYNDAFEEKERYTVLRKLGCSEDRLLEAMVKELCCAYGLPFLVMAVSAYFPVHALEKVTSMGLMSVYAVSVLVVFGFFLVFYGLSVKLYRKNSGF